MLKRRLIPVLFLKNGWMVRSESFKLHQFIGSPVVHVERMVQWDVDELIVINIGNSDDADFNHNRSDYPGNGITDVLTFVATIAEECRIPLTFGGGLRNFERVREVIRHGADKVSLNSMLFDNLEGLKKCISTFGSQAVVASVDYRTIDGENFIFSNYGVNKTDFLLDDWVIQLEQIGVGEIFLNAIDRDGKAVGYDILTVDRVSRLVKIPVIACGGAGHQRDFLECFEKTEASAVAAGNIFHFTENSYPRAKKYLKDKLVNVR
jgi:imidazole glycerol-phosphate synthase subunit HisF